jgi:hypothetical protein
MRPSSIVCVLGRRYTSKMSSNDKTSRSFVHKRMKIGKCLCVPVYENEYTAWCVVALFRVSPYFTSAHIFP